MSASRCEPAAAARRCSSRRRGIETFYGETQALFDVSLEVGAGEVVALLGPNGAGKTTTLRSILGLTPARRGSVALRRPRHHARRTHEIARGGIGWVPDDRRIFPTLTVARNLAIARKKTRFRAWTREGVLRDLQRARVPDATASARTCRAARCRWSRSRARCSARPGLVLFDEPSQGLAPKVVQDVMKTIARLQGRRRRGAAGRAERAERARGRRPRLRARPRRASSTGSGRGAARRRGAARGELLGAVMATPLLRVERLAKHYTPRPVSRR